MRKLLSLAVVLSSVSFASAQEGKPKAPEETPPRYGVAFKVRVYPQASPKEALNSLIEAVDKGDYGYIASHLMEPGYIDGQVASRAKQAYPQIVANLAALRDFQQQNLDKVAPEARIPVDAEKFKDRALADATMAGFKQLVKDLQHQLGEDPETMIALRTFRRAGQFPEAGDTAKLDHADIKNRSLFLKKSGDRWYIENRQVEEKAPEPAKPPEEKKQ